MPYISKTWWARFGKAAAIVALAILALWAMGRTPWGSAPGPGLWVSNIESEFNSQYFADPYTLTHVNHGLLFFLVLSWIAGDRLAVATRFWIALVVEACWEVVENTPFVIERFREATIAQGYYGDSILNSTGDILACAAGFLIATQLYDRWVLALFIGIELLLVFWIRDSMLLTLLMLVYPVPGIREWQFG